MEVINGRIAQEELGKMAEMSEIAVTSQVKDALVTAMWYMQKCDAYENCLSIEDAQKIRRYIDLYGGKKVADILFNYERNHSDISAERVRTKMSKFNKSYDEDFTRSINISSSKCSSKCCCYTVTTIYTSTDEQETYTSEYRVFIETQTNKALVYAIFTKNRSGLIKRYVFRGYSWTSEGEHNFVKKAVKQKNGALCIYHAEEIMKRSDFPFEVEDDKWESFYEECVKTERLSL